MSQARSYNDDELNSLMDSSWFYRELEEAGIMSDAKLEGNEASGRPPPSLPHATTSTQPPHHQQQDTGDAFHPELVKECQEIALGWDSMAATVTPRKIEPHSDVSAGITSDAKLEENEASGRSLPSLPHATTPTQPPHHQQQDTVDAFDQELVKECHEISVGGDSMPATVAPMKIEPHSDVIIDCAPGELDVFYPPTTPPAVPGPSTRPPSPAGLSRRVEATKRKLFYLPLHTSTPASKKPRVRDPDGSDSDDPGNPDDISDSDQDETYVPSPVTSFVDSDVEVSVERTDSTPPPSPSPPPPPTPSPPPPLSPGTPSPARPWATADLPYPLDYTGNLSLSDCWASDRSAWSKVPLRRVFPRQQPLPYTKGPTAATQGARTKLDFFNLFLDEGMLSDIVQCTNKKIKILQRKYKKDKATTSLLSLDELKAFLGILVTSGAKKERKVSLPEMWSSQHGCPIYRAAMSEKRFLFITRCLRFDDLDTRLKRQKEDITAPIKDIWERFLQHCRENYVPGDKLTVDEQLLGFRGRCSFRLYIKNKPNKYGLKIVMCCDAATYYMANATLDLGRMRKPKLPEGKAGEIFTLQVAEPYLDAGRTITTDNWFTSESLLKKLWDRNTFLVGTLRKRRFIPPVLFKLDKKRQEKTSVFLFSKNMMLASFKPKKERMVALLSSKHNKATIGDLHKPEVIHYYNETKGGVDVLDHMCAVYSCSRKTRRWPLCLFYGIINVAVINAYTIYKQSGQVVDTKERRLFMHQLARELVLPWAQHRLHTPTITKTVKNTISLCFDLQPPPPAEEEEKGPRKKKKCALCPYSKSQAKVRSVCAFCKNHICPRHMSMVCENCKDII